MRRSWLRTRARSAPVRSVPRLAVVKLENRLAPSGVPAQWVTRGSGGGGSLFSPQINPINAAEYYVSSDMGQLFHTTDAGATWREVDFRQLQGNHETRVNFTENPNIQYTIDYSSIGGVDHQRPAKTTDGGLTWQPLANDPTGDGAMYLYADAANHNRLVVTDYDTLYFSADGGNTWASKFTGSNNGAGLILGGAFWDGANIYLGTNSGILTSTNNGSTFAPLAVGGLPSGQWLISFAGAKQNGVTRFVGVTFGAADSWAGIAGYDNGGGGVVVTLDLGQSNWTVRALPTSAWPFFAGMGLTDVNTMYVAGGSSNGTPTVYKSSNGGGTWASVFQTTNNANIQTGWSGQGGARGWGYGELAMGFTVDTADANRVILTDFGFAHATTDGGATWQALYVATSDRNAAGQNINPAKTYHDSGLDNTTAWQVTWASPTNLFISNSDVQGQLSTDGGQTFGFGYTGHNRNSMYRVAVASNGTLYGAAGSVHDLYQSTTLTDARIDGANGAVMFSANGGVTWQTLHDFGHEVCWVATDPTSANRLYAAVVHSSATVGGVWVTNNLGAGSASTWTKLPNPPRTQGHPFNIIVLNDGTVVASYSGRRDAAGTFTASSGVFVSIDGGQTWSDRSSPGMQYWTKDVVIDPADPTQNTWYAGVYSGWGGPPNDLGGLYKTTNRGVSWTRITNGLDRVESITINPTDFNEAFLTTETQGLRYSSNLRTASPTFTQVASYTFRQPERVFFNPYNPNEIWVTGFGGGVRVGSVAQPVTVTAIQVGDGSAQRSEVRSLRVTISGPVTFANNNPAAAFQLTRVTGAGGSVGLSAGVSTNGSGQTVVTLSFNGTVAVDPISGQNGAPLSLANGRYQLTILNNAVTGTNGLALDGDNDGTAGGTYVSPTDTAPGGSGQLRLFRLFGDATGNGVVDLTDLQSFRGTFNAGTGNPAYLDFFDADHNGVVDLVDLSEFRSRFNQTVF